MNYLFIEQHIIIQILTLFCFYLLGEECDDWMLPTSTIIFDLLYHQLATMALFKVISEINNSINHNMTLWENGYKTRYLCVGFLVMGYFGSNTVLMG